MILSPSGDDDLEHTIAELQAQGYNRTDRKYVVWMDANELCGISSYYEDDRSDLHNFNNGNETAPSTVSRIDNGCWGLGSEGESIEAHELMHALGSVMPTARGICRADLVLPYAPRPAARSSSTIAQC